MSNCHDDERLNSLIGKYVEIKRYDNDIQQGVLERSPYSKRYRLKRYGKCGLEFYKSHIKWVKEKRNNGKGNEVY